MKWGNILTLVIKKGTCGVGCWSSVGGGVIVLLVVGGLLTRLENIRRTFKGVETVRSMALVVLVN